MTTMMNVEIAKYRIDDMRSAAEGRQLARAVRGTRRGRFVKVGRRGASESAVVTAEWRGATAARPARGLPA